MLMARKSDPSIPGIASRFWAWLLVVPLAAYFAFGFHHLSDFETADEHYWGYDNGGGRIVKYWTAIRTHDWARTRIDDKPGITVAILSGIGGSAIGNLAQERNYWSDDAWRHYDKDITLARNLAYRLPIMIVNGLMALFFFRAIRKLTKSPRAAFFACAMILVSPVIVGISQIVNPDALLWSFSLAAVLSGLLFFRDLRFRDGLWMTVFLGLAFLTKYTSIILVPYLGLALAYFLIFGGEETPDMKLARRMRRMSVGYLSAIIGASAMYALLMPAVFLNGKYFFAAKGVDGIRIVFILALASGAALFAASFFVGRLSMADRLRGLVGKAGSAIVSAVPFLFGVICLAALANWSFGGNFLGLKDIAFDAAQSKNFRSVPVFQQALLEIRPLVFAVTPLFLFLFLYALLTNRSTRKRRSKELVFLLALLILLLHAGVLYQKLLIDIRYGIILYPIVFIIAAIGADELLESFGWGNKMAAGILTSLALIVSGTVSLCSIKPYYFNYASDLLPKSQLIASAWGYGGYEAASYLNALPGIESATAWSDYEGFCPFFGGICVRGNETDHVFKDGPGNRDIKYLIATRRGRIKEAGTWKLLDGYYDKKPIFEIEIGGRKGNYVRVYEVTKSTAGIRTDD